MADETLGRFIFDFIVNTGGLDSGLEESTRKSNALSETVQTLITLLDVLEIRMNNVGLSAKDTAQASELLANTQQRTAESNEDLTTAIIALKENFDELAESQQKVAEESEKTDKQRDKQERGIASFTKKLLAMALAYASVNKIAGGFKGAFSSTFDIARNSKLLDTDAAAMKNWINIVEDAGGKASSVFETFKNILLQQGAIDIAGLGGPLLAAVNKLQLEIKDETGEFIDPGEILKNLAAAFEGTGDERAAALHIAGQLGISDDLFIVMAEGRAELERLLDAAQKESLQLTEQDTQGILELKAAISDVKQAAQDLFIDIGLDNLVEAIELLNGIQSALISIRTGELDFSLESMGTVFKQVVEEQLDKLKEKSLESTEERKRFIESGRLLDQTTVPISGAQTNANKTVTITGNTFTTPALTTEEAAVDLIAQIDKRVNGLFTNASQVNTDSIMS